MTRDELAADAATRFDATVLAISNSEDLSDEEKLQIPAWWLELIDSDSSESIQLALRAWDVTLPGVMRRFRQVMQEHGVDVSLVRMSTAEHTGLALQYTFDPPEGREFLFGYPPDATASPIVTSLPTSVQNFYAGLHNGLHNEPVSEPVGIYKADKLTVWEYWLGESELHYLSVPPEDPPLAKNLVMFFTDGAGGYIVINTDPHGTEAWNVGAGLFDDHPPGLWDIVDDWLALTLTGDFVE
ncbi:MAG: hypothetical protein ACRDUS_08720 [Mycobacterium sp.]